MSVHNITSPKYQKYWRKNVKITFGIFLDLFAVYLHRKNACFSKLHLGLGKMLTLS